MAPQDAVLYLWVDAICINQADLDERASQVALMARIYSECERTIIWLGPEDDNSHVAIRLIQTSEGYTQAKNRLGPELVRQHNDYWKARLEADVKHGVDPYVVLGTFMNRNWFHRTWTLQELILPPTVVFWCGYLDFSPEQLLGSIRRFSMTDPEAHIRQDNLDPIAFGPHKGSLRVQLSNTYHRSALTYITKTESSRISNSTAVSLARVRNSFDKRDHIYGMAGITGVDVPIDYRKPVAEVFTEFALASANIDGFNPENIEHRSKRQTPGLPSWVPDYAVAVGQWEFTSRGGNKIYYAGGGTGVQLMISTEPAILVVNGKVVDSVKHVVGRYRDINSGVFFVDCCAGLDALPKADVENIGHQTLIEMFWRTLIIDNFYQRKPEAEVFGPSFALVMRFYLAKWLSHLGPDELREGQRLKENLESLARKEPSSTHLPTWSEVEATAAKFATAVDLSDILDEVERATQWVYLDHLRDFFTDRCFFVTNDYRMGIGPDDLEPGTCVTVVEGCQYPWLLEEADTGGRYRLAGYAYVQGIMYGEEYVESAMVRIEIE
ncbi:hypothetical protein N0V82_000581 [Gnomoniopsis sp. IMI 355080]|nr:hypothetical protein N0V82_000581 [Gnomoniopsis sp. IMI 355080]